MNGSSRANNRWAASVGTSFFWELVTLIDVMLLGFLGLMVGLVVGVGRRRPEANAEEQRQVGGIDHAVAVQVLVEGEAGRQGLPELDDPALGVVAPKGPNDMAVVAPIPTPSVASTTAVKAGAFRRRRRASRSSVSLRRLTVNLATGKTIADSTATRATTITSSASVKPPWNLRRARKTIMASDPPDPRR